MTQPSAKVICDSISPDGVRLTTMEIVFHRYILAEANTHRAFSRNSASSRAIPTSKLIDRVLTDPALPIEWGSNQPGMQAGAAISESDALEAEQVWRLAASKAATAAQLLLDLNVHKQVTNRLLEPFLYHTAIITSTDWDNFWAQRSTKFSPAGSPEIRAVSDAMYAAYQECRWDAEPLREGDWHLPYLSADEKKSLSLKVAKRVSVARCARVSYLTHDGVRDTSVDEGLYEKLVGAKPGHWSPTEHVATPCQCDMHYAWDYDLGKTVTTWPLHKGNFRGWDQLRHKIGKECAHA